MKPITIIAAAACMALACEGSIEAQVAKDAEQQYEIAKRQGDAMQACAQASLVAAAYLQAKDEAKYAEWKGREKSDCAAAGVPQ